MVIGNLTTVIKVSTIAFQTSDTDLYFLNSIYVNIKTYIDADLTGDIQVRGQKICIYQCPTTGLSAHIQESQR